MKKRIFKFGAALTAALMICSATAGLAFADEIDAEVPETTEPAAVDTVDEAAPADEAVEEETPAVEEEAPAEEAEDVEEVVVPLEKEDVTSEDIAEAAADDPNYDPDLSVIQIGEIGVKQDGNYFTVNVPFTMKNSQAVPAQVTLFVYDITNILAGAGEYGFTSTAQTPVGYIDQKAAAVSFQFKLDSAKFAADHIMLAKIGGTDIDTPDAKSFKLEVGGEVPDVKLGDVDANGTIDMDDANLIMQFYLDKSELTDTQKTAANVDPAPSIDMDDANLIMQYYLDKITSFE